MEDIFFKARRADNHEWVEGGYFRDTVKEVTYIIYKDSCELSFVKVVGYTVCRFSGFYDHDGNPIFENDKLEHLLNPSSWDTAQYVCGQWTVSSHFPLSTHASSYRVVGNIF